FLACLFGGNYMGERAPTELWWDVFVLTVLAGAIYKKKWDNSTQPTQYLIK
ncbi:MAG: hypothetical protein RLZZ338_1850, partial [Cyanobacteriota bacterium]